MRRLTSVRRRVGDADLRRYDAAWEAAQAAATSAGARAWRFRSARDPLLFVEFIESSGADPRARPEVAEALRRLEEFGPGDGENWEEASGSSDGGKLR